MLYHRLFMIALLGIMSLSSALAQRSRDVPNFAGDNPFNKPDNEFLQTQWWLGFKGGVNFTEPVLMESQYVLSPIDYAENRNASAYEAWSEPSFHLGLDITFYHKGMSIGFQPNYRQQAYEYQTDFSWTGDTDVEQLSLTYRHRDAVDYIELPLFVKYDILGKQVRPFVFAGGYYAFRISGNKRVEVSGLDEASGGSVALNGETLRVNMADQFASQVYGVLGGVGVSFDFWNIRTVIDFTYRYGLSNVIEPTERYSLNQLVSLGEVPDDFRLNNLAASVSVDFPLRFISKIYEPF